MVKLIDIKIKNIWDEIYISFFHLAEMHIVRIKAIVIIKYYT